MKVGICECPPEMRPGSSEWGALCRWVSRESPDLFLLNEMPFGPWTSEGTPAVFHEIDPGLATRAQTEYPCYVRE